MRRVLVAMAVTLISVASASAFDAETQAAIGKYKSGKLVAATDLAQLMKSSALWCYKQEGDTCGWGDVYLEVTETGPTMEVGNAWDAELDAYFTDYGAFTDNRYVCETDYDWVPSVRVVRRSDNASVGGHELHAIKQQVRVNRAGNTVDCYDYLFLSADPETQVVTLLQRQYTDGAYIAGSDAEVRVHMDAAEAARLTWRW
jgi:hypothetical protein